MRLREKTTATLLIAILMISVFTFAVPVFAYSEVWVDDSYSSPSPPYYLTIQEGIDAVDPSGTVHIAEGTYAEQVAIDMSLTLEGAGDTTIIQPPAFELTATSDIPWIGTTHSMAAIVSVETAGGTVTVKNLKIDGSQIPTKSTTWVAGLVYLETGGIVEGVTVIGNPILPDRTAGIFGAAVTHTANLEVTGCTVEVYTRAGIYALGGTMTADYHHNAINGPGDTTGGVPNGMFFLEGATGSATYNTITDLGYIGELYRSTGIGAYRSGSGVVFGHNEISYVQNAFAIAGGSGATIEYNYVHDCHTGVKLEAIGEDRSRNVMIQYNDIHDNDFAIRCGYDMGDGNEAHYNKFVNNLGLEEEVGGDTYVGAVCNIHETYWLDATYNWWGTTDPVAITNMISGYVYYDPWLDAAPSKTAMTVTLVLPTISFYVTPINVNFGNLLPSGDSDVRTVTVHNNGDADLLITGEILDDTEGFFDVYLSITPPELEFVGLNLNANSNVGVDLQLKNVPRDPGKYTATLVFWAEEII